MAARILHLLPQCLCPAGAADNAEAGQCRSDTCHVRFGHRCALLLPANFPRQVQSRSLACHAVRPGNSLNPARRSFVAPGLRHVPAPPGPARRNNGCVRSPRPIPVAASPSRKGVAGDLPLRRCSFCGRLAVESEASPAAGATRAASQVNCSHARSSRLLGRCRRATFRKSAPNSPADLTPAQQHDLKGKNVG